MHHKAVTVAFDSTVREQDEGKGRKRVRERERQQAVNGQDFQAEKRLPPT